METMKSKGEVTLEELLNNLREDEECDKEDFARKRSNVLLIAGEHYSRKQSLFHRRIRESKDLSNEQKLRITKNHIQKIVKAYVNNILSMNPGVGFRPKNETELQDQKAAELHHAVWRDAYHKYDIPTLIEEWCDDFIGIGEVATKIFWDPTAGDIVAYDQKLDDDGKPLFDENGEPVKGAPRYSGGFIFEPIYGFNLLRDRNAKRMRESSRLTIRKMVDVAELVAKFPEHEEKIQASIDETFTVFDAAKGGYAKAEGQVMLLETYYRPCAKYPQGYFCFYTKEVKLISGPLPGGIFPIVWEGCDTVQTSPRGRSIVEIMRPYQAEINRAASKMAEHQITLGDDKIILQNGTKVSAGIALPGVRSINVTGGEPTILNGRDGSQYLSTITANIEELYRVMNVFEDEQLFEKGQIDPVVLLFRSGSSKKRFQRYIKRFERFLINVAKTYLRLAKIYLPDDALIEAIGRSEAINMVEFKNSNELGFEITVESQSDDIETKLGKQLILTQALQYVGSKLERDDIGKIMRAMPYANFEESFSDLTIDYDAATNAILALDRGEKPPIDPSDNHSYMVKRLTARKRKSDFKYLPDVIKANYDEAIQLHSYLEAERLRKLKAMESEFIPTGGYLVTCDFYMADPKDKTKTKRARLPYEAVAWLIKQLEAQGASLEQLEQQESIVREEIANQMLQQQGMGAHGTGMPMPQPELGAATPGVFA